MKNSVLSRFFYKSVNLNLTKAVGNSLYVGLERKIGKRDWKTGLQQNLTKLSVFSTAIQCLFTSVMFAHNTKIGFYLYKKISVKLIIFHQEDLLIYICQVVWWGKPPTDWPFRLAHRPDGNAWNETNTNVLHWIEIQHITTSSLLTPRISPLISGPDSSSSLFLREAPPRRPALAVATPPWLRSMPRLPLTPHQVKVH